jgi:kynurenine formamidase
MTPRPSSILCFGRVARLVDLSQEIYQGMPVYPGHLRTVVWDTHSHSETAANFEGGFSYRSNGLLLSDHGPTHVDALSHLDPSGSAPNIDEMPLDTFVGPGVCLDISHRKPLEYVTRGDLEQAARSSATGVSPGDIVLLYTGTEARYGGTPEYTTDYPGLDESAAVWLLEQSVKAFGVDSPSPDNPKSRTYPCHMMCRAHGVTHYENLANLAEVADRRFTFVGLPLRIRGGSGSPVRAIAMLAD